MRRAKLGESVYYDKKYSVYVSLPYVQIIIALISSLADSITLCMCDPKKCVTNVERIKYEIFRATKTQMEDPPPKTHAGRRQRQVRMVLKLLPTRSSEATATKSSSSMQVQEHEQRKKMEALRSAIQPIMSTIWANESDRPERVLGGGYKP